MGSTKQYGSDMFNCYLAEDINELTTTLKSPPGDRYLYLTVDKSIPKFEDTIKIIMNCQLYVEHYVLDVLSDITIIKLKYPEKHYSIYDHFINGRYSKMYGQGSSISCEQYLFKQEFKVTTRSSTNPPRYEHAYGVLSHSDSYFRTKILPLLSTTDQSVINSIRQNEYDSMIDHKDEVILN